jgi:NADH-quinone oxidoreductase subunit N
MLAYIAIEGLSLQVYALAILNFTTISIEIILKYFLLGSLASAILLYGISLLYGLYGSLNFFILKNSFFKIYLLDFFFNSNLCKISIFLIFFGLLFKLGLYPLHF